MNMRDFTPRFSKRVAWIICGCAIAVVSACNGTPVVDVGLSLASSAHAQDADTLLSTSQLSTPEGEFTFSKRLAQDGRIYEIVLNEQGAIVDASKVPTAPQSPLGATLQSLLPQLASTGALVVVDISLRDDVVLERAPGSAEVAVVANQSNEIKGTINGSGAGAAEFADDTSRIAKELDEHQARRRELRRDLLARLNDRERFDVNAAEQEAIADSLGPVVRTIAASEVERMVSENRDVIAAVELHQEGKDFTLASAMTDTSVDPGARQLPDSQGTGIGVYLTESGCPPAGFLTNYTLLAGSNTDHSRNTTSILRAVSPAAWIYCRGGAVLPTAADLAGSNGNPRVHIVSRSNGFEATEYGGVDRDWDNLTYANFVLISQAAGNSGNAAVVGTPGKGLNVVTVGNYNDSNDTINASSSGGQPTNTRNNKPELSAPGTNIDAGGFTMTGTSMSTPHVAGMMADAMQAYPWLQFRPAIGKSHALAAATDFIAGDSGAVGSGGADYLSGYYSFHDFWWWGPNDYFTTAAASDAVPGNGAVDVTYSFSAGQRVRVALAWPNNGTYTFDHRADPHPIGIDLDMFVYAPNGMFVAASASWDDPYERVDFVADQSGVYRIEIRRYANRDTAAISDMGLTINW